MVSEYVFSPIFLTTVLLPLTLWSAFWKGVALWRAGRNKQTSWFIALLVINTAGILEIIYLLFFAESQAQKRREAYQSKDTALSKTAATMEHFPARKQAIISILMSLLDTEHQNTISQQSLDRIVDAIEKRLDGELNQSDFLNMLDADMSKGGAGLYAQTAQKIASHIEAVINASKK